MLTKGCRATSMPSARASRPMTRPLSSASLTLKVAATPMVAVSPCDGWRVSTPGGPSAKRSPGMSKARNAGEIAGLALVDGGIFLGAVDQGELLLERHLAEKLVDAGVAGDDGDGLSECECGCEREECARAKNARCAGRLE